MRGILRVFAMLAVTGALWAQLLPECYHTREEVNEFIFALQDSFPDKVKVDSIGHSRGEHLGAEYPIYAVKISDNVEEFENEPVVLIIAHIHAEEVAGLEATLTYMRRLVNNQQPWRNIRNETQIYVIPTMNPDGLEVISRGWDNTWRKNGYVPPQLQLDSCVVVQGMGEDSCGVDLNRNFDINWLYGDTLWMRGSEEPFDYYRGPSPFSEPEARAVRDFSREIKPALSIVWHSSRSGRVAERCIVAWQWGPDGAAKFAPDSAAIHRVMHGYTTKTSKYPTNSGPYLEVFGATRNGALQDWFYRELGTIQILTETSPPENIQPECDSTLASNLPDLIETLVEPMQWLCRRTINLPVDDDMADQGAPLVIYTHNASTGAPISAEYRIVETWSPILNPWTTHPTFGRATIINQPGTISVMARKEGFVSDTVTVSLGPGGPIAERTLELEPLPWHSVTINVRNGSGQLLPARVYFDNGFPQTYELQTGTITLSKPRTVCQLRVEPLAEQQVIARWFSFWHDRDTTLELVLPGGDLVFSENFEGGLGNWSGGADTTWQLEADTTSLNYGMVVHTNQPGYRRLYGNNWDVRFTYNNTINLTAGNAYHLKFDRRGRLDMPADSFLVEVSVNGTDWQQAGGFTDLQMPWTPTYVDLSYWAGNSIHLRFRLKTDSRLGDMGLLFDNLEIVGGIDTSAPEQPLPFPQAFRLTKVYPNPFNPTTTIAYEAANSGPVSFAIYNLLGQEVWSVTEVVPGAGHFELRWNGVNSGNQVVPSGIYFVQMQTARGLHGTQKLMFLK